MRNTPVLELRPEGLYCPAGGFFIDPWRPVERAVITHAHSDHARWGMKSYLCADPGLAVLRARMAPDAVIESIPYGQSLTIGDAKVSLHPAGHLLGSAQVRVETDSGVWVVTGDYKTEPDGTCAPFEPVQCHGIVTETTFGLPIYRWRPQAEIFAEIAAWHSANIERGVVSVLAGYSLGKAQRMLYGLKPYGFNFVVHGAVASMNRAYESAGVDLPAWNLVSDNPAGREAMVIAPPSAIGSPWLRRFGDVSVAFASGWMAVRGIRRRKAVDRGFVLSDHVDWPSLMEALRLSGAETVWTTHGYADVVARYLGEQGLNAQPLQTQFGDDEEEVAASE